VSWQLVCVVVLCTVLLFDICPWPETLPTNKATIPFLHFGKFKVVCHFSFLDFFHGLVMDVAVATSGRHAALSCARRFAVPSGQYSVDAGRLHCS